jgi:hypothetical protein
MITKTELLKHTENKTGKDVRVDNEIVCSENKSTYRYVNKSRQHVAKIKVDGGLVPSTDTKKCDWLLINWDSAHSFFVELKGCDVKKAIDQINATLDLLWADVKTMGIGIAHARIVLSKTPNPNFIRSEQRILEKRLKLCSHGAVKNLVKIGTTEITDTF